MHLQISYSFKDELILAEVAHKHSADFPAVRVFAKASAGVDGVGRPSAGAPQSSTPPLMWPSETVVNLDC